MLNKLNHIIIFLFLSGVISSCNNNQTYSDEIKTFRAKRVNYLKSRKGYLNLVGLHWIFNGTYTLGASQDNDLPFPKSFPSNFGKLVITNDSIKFNFDFPVLVDSSNNFKSYNFSKNDLQHDFSWKSFQWFIVKRGENYALRIKDFENYLISEIDKIPAFTIDTSWRINGIFKPYLKEQERTISNIWGHAVEQPTAGIVTFNYANQVYELESNIESGKLAVIFKDGTTGNETYSGGRQLYLSKPDKDGEVILDFNKSFNFPCAFNDFTTCP
ncbi:MAG: DUF1684 domain-containing protein, partial [Candidatus Marinimicrobia bacterium]|nr:DUF1684 domain-containing protein [Candidatus Neomarinimicrobiota bacterium]